MPVLCRLGPGRRWLVHRRQGHRPLGRFYIFYVGIGLRVVGLIVAQNCVAFFVCDEARGTCAGRVCAVPSSTVATGQTTPGGGGGVCKRPDPREEQRALPRARGARFFSGASSRLDSTEAAV